MKTELRQRLLDAGFAADDIAGCSMVVEVQVDFWLVVESTAFAAGAYYVLDTAPRALRQGQILLLFHEGGNSSPLTLPGGKYGQELDREEAVALAEGGFLEILHQR